MPEQLFDLTGKVALVTGTSRGLGQYFALALARAGADIAMTSRTKTSLAGSRHNKIRRCTKMKIGSNIFAKGVPVNRPGLPDDLDGAIVFLASESSRYITGQTLLVDGGISTGATRATL